MTVRELITKLLSSSINLDDKVCYSGYVTEDGEPIDDPIDDVIDTDDSMILLITSDNKKVAENEVRK